MRRLRPEARWIVDQLVQQTGLSEAEVEVGILQLIDRGHLRIMPGQGSDGSDAFEVVLKGRGDG
jgi:hypothetical protein